MVLVRDDRRVGLAAEVGRLVDGGRVVGVAVAHPDDHARGEREIGGVQVGLARLVLGQIEAGEGGLFTTFFHLHAACMSLRLAGEGGLDGCLG